MKKLMIYKIENNNIIVKNNNFYIIALDMDDIYESYKFYFLNDFGKYLNFRNEFNFNTFMSSILSANYIIGHITSADEIIVQFSNVKNDIIELDLDDDQKKSFIIVFNRNLNSSHFQKLLNNSQEYKNILGRALYKFSCDLDFESLEELENEKEFRK